MQRLINPLVDISVLSDIRREYQCVVVLLSDIRRVYQCVVVLLSDIKRVSEPIFIFIFTSLYS